MASGYSQQTNDIRTPRQIVLARNSGLRAERASWDGHYQDLSDYIQPRRARFGLAETNKGDKKHQKIVNNTATRAADILANFMMAGITSPARPWFRYATRDLKLNEVASVKEWLHLSEERTRMAFSMSNIYKALPQVYADIIVFGVSVPYLEPDPRTVLRAYVFPPGQYCLANGADGKVDTLYREFRMTVKQLVDRFGFQKCSDQAKQAYNNKQYDQWVDVMHVIEPNTGRDPSKLDAKGKAFKSCWLEKNGGDHDGFLREAGYARRPFMGVRWSSNGEDVYGSSPGMEALGDAKALQLLEKRAMQMVDKFVNPPMVGPSALQHARVSLLPGDVTYVDTIGAGRAFQPAFEMDPRFLEMSEAKIREHEQRLRTTFKSDLAIMLGQQDAPQRTAREITELHEEKMLQMGPVLETLHDELLGPLIEWTMGELLDRGLLPPPPEELQGQELEIEYTSILAQAQKAVGTIAIDRLLSVVAGIAPLVPDILDNVNTDNVVKEVSTMLGTKPSLIRTTEEVAKIRALRAQQQQQQAATEQAMAATQGAKTLSETSTEGDNALTRILGAYGAPGGVPTN